MPRQIISGRDLLTSSEADEDRKRGLAGVDSSGEQYAGEPDGYRERLLKYIPAEVVALYLSLTTMLQADTTNVHSAIYGWIALAFAAGVTPLYLWRIQNVTKAQQLLLSTISLVVWAFALGGPFKSLDWYDASLASLVLACSTFALPLIDPK